MQQGRCKVFASLCASNHVERNRWAKRAFLTVAGSTTANGELNSQSLNNHISTNQISAAMNIPIARIFTREKTIFVRIFQASSTTHVLGCPSRIFLCFSLEAFSFSVNIIAPQDKRKDDYPLATCSRVFLPSHNNDNNKQRILRPDVSGPRSARLPF